MTLHIRLQATTHIPLEVEGITPDAIREKKLADIQQLPIFHGNQKVPFAEFFHVSGDAADERMEWEGDLRGVHWIGTKMRSGVIHVAGNAGRHLGSEMRGGEIRVDGDAGDWVGGEMRGGMIHVQGRAGHLIGAAYRGSARGMRGGTIVISGDAGNEIGHTLRRGTIAIGGNVGDLVGFNMLAGSIFIFGSAGIRHGANMRRGTIGFFGEPPPVLPSFRFGCRFSPTVMRLIAHSLQRYGLPGEALEQPVDLFNGDLVNGGRGEFLIRSSALS